MKKRTLESFDPARRRCLGFNSKTDTGAVSSATSSGQYLQFFFQLADFKTKYMPTAPQLGRGQFTK